MLGSAQWHSFCSDKGEDASRSLRVWEEEGKGGIGEFAGAKLLHLLH